MLTDDELKELLEPILEALNKLDQELGSDLTQIPQVRIIADSSAESMEIDEETLHQIEDYIQSYIENEHQPTILH